jgi:signal transduction histidine kinase
MSDLFANFVNPQTLPGWITWGAALIGVLLFALSLMKANKAIERNTKKGLVIGVGVGILVLGIAVGFLFTRSLFTSIELLGYYLVILSIFQLRNRDAQRSLRDYLWLSGASSHIISFAISFFMAESSFAVRMDYALTHGFVRWLVLFAISLAVLFVSSAVRKGKISFLSTASAKRHFGEQVSSPHGHRVIIFTVAMFLLISALVWGLVKPVMMRSIDQELIAHTEDLTSNSYAYYEMGQALIQLTGNALCETAQSQLSEEDLIQLINRFPLYSQLLLVDGGQISTSYPEDEYRFDSQWLEDSCEKAGKAGAISSVINPLQAITDNSQPMNAFIAPARRGQCVFGLSFYEDTLLFSDSINKINELSADWSFVDQYGAGILYGEPATIIPPQETSGLPVSPRFSKGQVGTSIVPWIQWRHTIDIGQWQHSLTIRISPELLMHRLSSALLVSLMISGIFTFGLTGNVLSRQKVYSSEIASIYDQVKGLTEGDVKTQSDSVEDQTNGGIFGGVNKAIEKFRHQLAIKRQLLWLKEQICEAETIETLVDILRNDSNLRRMGELQLTLHPQLGNQTVVYITPGAIAVPPVSTSSGVRDHEHNPYTSFVDSQVNGKLIHRYVFHNNQEVLGTFSCMHAEAGLSVSNQEYLDSIARQISLFLHQQELSRRYKKRDEQWQMVFESFPFPAMILNSQAELLHINQLARNLDFINENLVSNMVHLQVFLNDQDMVRQIQQAVKSPSIASSVNAIEHGTHVIHVSKIDKQEQDTNPITIVWFQDISDETEKFSFQANILTTTLHRLRKEFETLRGRLQLFSASGSLNQSQALHYKEISRSLDEIKAFMQATSLEERFSAEANLVLRPINIIDVLIQAIRSLKPFADQNKVAVSFSNKIERNDVLVMADQMVIMEAFKHLLDNAIRYNTIGGQVSILVTEDASNVDVTIKDTGAGLSALDMARINSDQPLSVTAEGKIKFGTGLRLAKSIFNKHGGKLSVSSVLGEGSTTRITLPKQS